MSVLVFVDHAQGTFKKNAFEAINYAAKTAEKTGGDVVAVVLGSASDSELATLGNYGATQILHCNDTRLDHFCAKAYTKAVVAAVNQSGATVIVVSANNNGKAVAPMVAAQLKAGIVAGAVDYPNTTNGFSIKKSVFSGKAFAHVNINSDKKVISLTPNTFAVAAVGGTASVQALSVDFADTDFGVKFVSEDVVKGEVPLSEAERVVSGGRGLKGPENWGILEDLAKAMNATLACSRPVADAHWRPHHEHVGQTGGTIRPNLYVAVGISGAIQHLAGVNSSKTIVVINKDADAPFFKAADYGVVGDAFEILPKLTEAVNKAKG
ncbi:electron transfer flavoprotein subunit alpha [Taibaiella sp. KBW10]|uniref:electron transfer flavoprotein subunit alpha/FixB family protein n=1 Tax=Taibaiella sp. KBW10 TaxID=2153357 RepID=UPI000F5AACDB|nr:electron transfer flavoprotein subunit alpha/FixB family protein [Taibaiella sp. KBW10]RQO30473.1 electron transfer flavoprotein subunit alpha [Taibaiella sp. KBW10]